MVARLLSALLFFTLSASTVARSQTAKTPSESSSLSKSDADSPPATLSFREFFDRGTAELKPSPKLLALSGKRVRLIGYMVQMEVERLGGFYLSSRPTFCDEEGGGTADLPPDTVFVIVSSYKDKKMSFVPGPLEVTGTLELSRRESTDGAISFINLTLEKPNSVATTPDTDLKKASVQ
jgi:hypothetical protein